MEQPMHQTQMTMPQHHQTTATAIHPGAAAMAHMAAAAAAATPQNAAAAATAAAAAAAAAQHHHFLSSPALASPAGSTNNATHPANPQIAANAPCSTLFVANLGQFVSEHELKEVFSR
ncbi:GL12580 [Drosophila persimilis]|uniref:GL12580 n=2 Tax=pseudoobscura subgroup TaxID=32358 RepID=B4GLJ5_DROPE|nr:GL12580 [Drosophila persimilis]